MVLGCRESGEREESGELAISLNVLPQTTRFNEAEAHAPRMREGGRPTRSVWHRQLDGQA